MNRPNAPWSEADLVVRWMDGPPDHNFDCGRNEQNAFLYDHAWGDHSARISSTSLFYVHGILAGYSTTLMKSFSLPVKQKIATLRFKDLPATFLAQLGVHRPYQSTGLGRHIVTYVIELARQSPVACRFVILDAQPDLVGWYADQGFEINKPEYRVRQDGATARKRDPEAVNVPMYFDLGAR